MYSYGCYFATIADDDRNKLLVILLKVTNQEINEIGYNWITCRSEYIHSNRLALHPHACAFRESNKAV